MGSNPVASIFAKMRKPEYEPAKPHVPDTPESEHQPMYRKKESKPGQKEKQRVIVKRNASPSPHRRATTDRNSKNRNGKSKSKDTKTKDQKTKDAKPKDAKSKDTKSKKSPTIEQNGGSAKKTTPPPPKQNNKSKKKKKNSSSKLAFWFCVSANADKEEDKSNAPIKKQPSAVVDQSNADNRSLASIEDPLSSSTEILATKHTRRNVDKRYSAPPSSEWTTIVTRAIVETHSEPCRSRTPTSGNGARYRYGGTLEKPYVFPGGLTFESPDRSRLMEDRTISSSFCDTTMDDESHTRFDSINGDTCNGETDIRDQFYLRYDQNPSYVSSAPSRPCDRRYSMPIVEMVVDNQSKPGQRLYIQKEDVVDNTNDSFTNNTNNTNNSSFYDEPYEPSAATLEREKIIMKEPVEKRNSYYTTPIQTSKCIYMWHSCEDLQHCEKKYHSQEEINHMREYGIEIQSNKDSSSQETSTNTLDNDLDENPAVQIAARPISVVDGPSVRDSIKSRAPGHSRHLSLPVNLSQGDFNEKPVDGIMSSEDAVADNKSNSITSDDTNTKFENHEYVNMKNFFNLIPPPPLQLHEPQKSPEIPPHRSLEKIKQEVNPFSRNRFRSSAMPGNKRFFIPPPPSYTPPKEEMEATFSQISKYSCHRSSQTDLADDMEELEMVDRDSTHKNNKNSLSNDKAIAKTAILKNGGEIRLTNDCENTTNNSIETSQSSTNISNENDPREIHPGSNLNDDISPPSSNNKPSNTHDGVNDGLNDKENNGSKRQKVKTSTPKPDRRLDLGNEMITSFQTFPKPVPRKRNRNVDTVSTSFSIQDSGSAQHEKMTVTIKELEKSNSIASSVVTIRTAPLTKPVPKKRRSQMIEPDDDTSYTEADIVKGLAKIADNEHENENDSANNANNATNDKSQNKNGSVRGHHRAINTPNSLPLSSLNNAVLTDTCTTSATTVVVTDATRISITQSTQTMPSPVRRNLISHTPTSSSPDAVFPGHCTKMAPIDHLTNSFRLMSYDSDMEDNCNADDEMSVHNDDIGGDPASVHILLRSRSIFDRSLAVTRKRRQRMRDRKCHSQLLSSADLEEYDTEMGLVNPGRYHHQNHNHHHQNYDIYHHHHHHHPHHYPHPHRGSRKQGTTTTSTTASSQTPPAHVQSSASKSTPMSPTLLLVDTAKSRGVDSRLKTSGFSDNNPNDDLANLGYTNNTNERNITTSNNNTNTNTISTYNKNNSSVAMTHLLKQKSFWKHSYTDSGNDSDVVSPNDVYLRLPPRPCEEEEVFKQCVDHELADDYFKRALRKNAWEVRPSMKKLQLRRTWSIEDVCLLQNLGLHKDVSKPNKETCV